MADIDEYFKRRTAQIREADIDDEDIVNSDFGANEASVNYGRMFEGEAVESDGDESMIIDTRLAKGVKRFEDEEDSGYE